MQNPPWYFKDAGFSNQEAIIEEFRKAIPHVYNDFNLDAEKSIYRAGINNDEVKKNMPLLSAQMKELGLYDAWTSTSFITMVGTEPNFPAHIDAPATATKAARVFALNWPIYNCDESITRFWELPDELNVSNLKNDSVSFEGPRYSDLTIYNLKFACEYTLTKATWLRVDMPHSLELLTNKNRICASMRFSPEPFDYLGL
jgi:hypothetical protein